MFTLRNKIALVTGAGSGIGAAIAESLAEAAALVVVTDVNATAARQTLDRIVASGGKAECLALDVTSESHCQTISQTVLEHHGRLDVLVNNAGIGCVGTLLQTRKDDLDRLLAVNLYGVLNVTRAFLPTMLERKSGSVINMASIGGIVGVKDRVAYCASKFAVVGITKSMALDHALDGIRFNCICPGRVETPFVTARLNEYPDPAKARAEMSATQAIGRMGHPHEIAAAAVYLASDEAAFVTGSALIIDGGFSAGK